MNYLYLLFQFSVIIAFFSRYKRLLDLVLITNFYVFIVFIYIAFYRENIGNDYYSYKILYQDFYQFSGTKEPIYEYLTIIFKYLRLDFEYFAAFLSILTIVNFYFSGNVRWLFMACFFSSGYMFFAFDQIRQALAISFLIPIIFVSKTKMNYVGLLVFGTLAMGIHYVSIVYLISVIFFRICNFGSYKNIYILIIIFAFSFREQLSFVNILPLILKGDLFLFLFNNERFLAVNESFGATLLLANVTFILLCLMQYDRKFSSVVNLCFFWNFSYILMYDNFILNRLAVLGFYLPLFAMAYIFINCGSKKNKLIFWFTYCVWSIHFCLTVIYELGKHGAFPLILRS